MPTYEYACEKCGDRIEVFQSFTAKPLKKHADCGGSLQKVFHASGVVFKGSGFYVTDSKRSTNSASQSSSSSSTSTSTSSKADGKAHTETEKAVAKDTTSSGES